MLNATEKTRLKLLQAKIAAASETASAVELTEDDERFLDLVALKSDRQNTRKRALAGGTLTGPQRARLSRSLVEGEAEVDDGVTYVTKWDDLADAIPIHRRTLLDFRNEHEELIQENKKLLFRSDDRKCVPEWRQLLAEFGVKGRGANNTDANSLDARQLDLAERRFKLEKAQFELEKAKQSQLPVAQFERAWFKNQSALLAAINAFGPRVNENLEGLDFDERAVVIDRECERLKQTIAACDYLTPEEEEDGG